MFVAHITFYFMVKVSFGKGLFIIRLYHLQNVCLGHFHLTFALTTAKTSLSLSYCMQFSNRHMIMDARTVCTRNSMNTLFTYLSA